jgi:hypothetical protein
MEHYVGLDVSLKLTAICIVDQTGKIEREGVVASDPETIAAFIKSHARMSRESGLKREPRRRGYGPSSIRWGYPSSASMPGMRRRL